ncbi:MAG: hypothetical protein ACOCWQ_02910 [Nanoarchaeota archaeon]
MFWKKKAQSALEFLTTYGWAFLVILIMIGALSYFGVLDPSRFLPDKCVASTGFTCGEMTARTSDNTIRVMLTNSVGKDIDLEVNATDITATGMATECELSDGEVTLDTDSVHDGLTNVWKSGETREFVITCDGIEDGERPEIQVEGAYTPAGATYPKPFDLTISVKAN